MAPLTWKNVAAPDFSGAGNLLSGATLSLNSALDSIRNISDRNRDKTVNTNSGELLKQLASIQDPNQIASVLGQFNGADLSAEALDTALGYRGQLLDNQMAEGKIDYLNQERNFERQDREGESIAARALRDAQIAGLQGDEAGVQGAFGNIQNPDALRAIQGSLNNAVTNTNQAQGVQDERLAENSAGVVDRLLSEFPNANDAALSVQNSDEYSPEEKRAIQAQIGTQASQFGQVPSNVKGVFENPSAAAWAREYDRGQRDAQVFTNIKESQDSANPLNLMNNVLQGINTAVTDDSPKGIEQYVTEQAGVDTRGTDWSGINQDIDDIKQELSKEGINTSRKEIAAALVTTSKASNVPFNDSMVAGNKDSIIKLLKESKDPSKIAAAVDKGREIDNIYNNLDTLSTEIDELDNQYKFYQSKGNLEAAGQAAIELRRKSEQYNQIANSAVSTFAPKPKAEDQKPTARERSRSISNVNRELDRVFQTP